MPDPNTVESAPGQSSGEWTALRGRLQHRIVEAIDIITILLQDAVILVAGFLVEFAYERWLQSSHPTFQLAITLSSALFLLLYGITVTVHVVSYVHGQFGSTSAKLLGRLFPWALSAQGSPAGTRPYSTSWRRGVELAVAVLVGVTVSALAAWTFGRPTASTTVTPIRFMFPPPDGYTFGNAAVPSPDGRHLAFHTRDAAGSTHVWLHSFETGQSRPLPGLINTNIPWWSPDSRSIAVAVTTEGNLQLKRIDIDGNLVATIAELDAGTSLGSWNDNGVIIFGQNPGPLMRVLASGGKPTPVTVLDPSRQERTHSGPHFLPDGRHFVYARLTKNAENSGIFLGSLDAVPQEQDLRMLAASTFSPGYATTSDPRVGYLLYLRATTLVAQALDQVTFQLMGEPIAIAERVGNNAVNTGLFSGSADVLVHRDTPGTDGRFVWVDRNGRETALVDRDINGPEFPRLSPDGTRFAAAIERRDIWVYDVTGKPPIKLTFNGGNFSPLWTPDGRSIVYEGSSPEGIFSIRADGSGGSPERILPIGHYHPHAWSADGRWLLAIRMTAPQTGRDIVKIPLDGKGDAVPVVETPAEEGAAGATLSPDGRWLAYASNLTGQREIYVQPFPESGPRVRISPNGGTEPVWAKNGHELFYLEGNTMIAVGVDTTAGFRFTAPARLFEARLLKFIQPPSYDVASDGRFLMVRPADAGAARTPLTIMLNWQEALQGTQTH